MYHYSEYWRKIIFMNHISNNSLYYQSKHEEYYTIFSFLQFLVLHFFLALYNCGNKVTVGDYY